MNQKLAEVQKQFSGNIIQPQDQAYQHASAVLLRRGSPAVIFECANPSDVALAIGYARNSGLILSVRSGGHSTAGLGTNDNGVVLDVGPMNKVTVINNVTNHVRIGAGAKWGDVSKTLHKFGLGISAGDTVSVGASGLTLGGGIGWMVRQYGLAIDSLVGAEVVTVDGKMLTANKTTNEDLFWAIRGGGGNFGVVTSLEFIAHPVGDVHAGTIIYSTDDLAAKVRGWRDYMRKAPEALTTTALIVPSEGEGDAPLLIITCCWDGDEDSTAQTALAPLRKLGAIISDDVKKKHYYEVLEEAYVPPGVHHQEVNNAFFHQLTDEVISKIVTAFQQHNLIFQIRSIGGAMNRVPADVTAFSHRDSEAMVVSPLFLPPNASEEQIQAALQPWQDIAKDGNGAYVNFFSRTTKDEVAASYPQATYRRLASIKHRYDPDNIFSQNFNIKPVV